jgi:predicted metalloendopeptidase
MIVCVAMLASSAAMAQAQAQAQAPALPPAPVSFDRSAMDVNADPCKDFYQYACGGWRAANPIPADKARYGRFDQLREYNLYLLHNILEDAAKPGKHSPEERKVGTFYAACMDEKTVDVKGIQPIEWWLKEAGAVTNKQQILDLSARMQAGGLRPFFGFGATADLHNSTMNIAQIDQGGLTLADRDYYLKQDAKMVEVRGKYVEHIERMLMLAGETAEQAKADAKAILALEKKLAEASMDRVARRDPKNRDHRMTMAEVEKMAPEIDFARYFTLAEPKFNLAEQKIKLPGPKDKLAEPTLADSKMADSKIGSLNVANPEFFQKLGVLLNTEPTEVWRSYLRWRIIKSSAPLLSKPFVDENFEFQGKYLSGQKEIEARWKRCTAMTDSSLGELLGPLYVAKQFPKEAKQRMDALVAAIEGSMDTDIASLEWMSPETKKAAKDKLRKVSNKIGYPAKWKDYSSVTMKPDDFAGNVRVASIYEVKRDLDKLGKPVDRSEWGMTPPTVNAYYDPSQNNINFPAGILQPPFFSAKVDEAVNYGGIGVVIGHELTHGFDDQGRKYDGDGNLANWWSPEDGVEFERRAKCVADEYSSFVPVQDDKGEVHLNGKLTLGENTADNGGLTLAYMAMEERGKSAGRIAGFTPEQRFFVGFAQVWCENVTPQRSREMVLTDPHSPGRFRVIGAVQNSGEFSKAFGCKSGDAMVAENACRVW